MRKRFKTKKYVYHWGTIYDPETEEKLYFETDSVYGRTDWAWIMTYQKSEESIPKIIRILFVD